MAAAAALVAAARRHDVAQKNAIVESFMDLSLRGGESRETARGQNRRALETKKSLKGEQEVPTRPLHR
jgi:hypothetical protein